MDIENDPRFAEPDVPDSTHQPVKPSTPNHPVEKKPIESNESPELRKPLVETKEAPEESSDDAMRQRKGRKRTKRESAAGEGAYFLFEITESKAKGIYLEYKDKNIDVQDVNLFPDESRRNSQAEMNWTEFSLWIKKIIDEKPNPKKINVKIILVGHGAYNGVLKRSEIGKVSEMRDKIAWQVAESVPFAIDTSLISYELNRETVTVGAVDPEFLNKVLTSFHEASIYPLSVSLLPVSFQAIIKKHAILKEKTFLLVHIARHHTYLLHFYHGAFHSFRELSIGGEHVTQAMLGTLMLDDQSINIGYEEAVVLKENVGIPTKNLEVNPDEPKNSQLSMRIRPIFDRLVSDINNSIKQFKTVVPGAELYSIILTGGGAQMKGLEEFFTGRLYHKTKILEMSEISTNVRLSEVQLLGMLFSPLNKFNFASIEDILKPRFEKAVTLFKKSFVLLIVFMLLFAGMTWVKKTIASVRYKNLKDVYMELGASEESMMEVDNLINKITSLHSARKNKIASELPIGRALKEITLLIPQTIIFKEIDFSDEADPILSIRGAILESNRSPDIILSGFIESLEGSIYFEQTKLESRSASETDPKQIDFIIKTRLVRR